jgi:hypothetical protein
VGVFVLVRRSFRLGWSFTAVVIVSVVAVSSTCVALVSFCIVVGLSVLLIAIFSSCSDHLEIGHAIAVERFLVAFPYLAFVAPTIG